MKGRVIHTVILNTDGIAELTPRAMNYKATSRCVNPIANTMDFSNDHLSFRLECVCRDIIPDKTLGLHNEVGRTFCNKGLTKMFPWDEQ